VRVFFKGISMSIEIGTKGAANLVVHENDLASILVQQGKDDFPQVFATCRMIGLMELAASRVLHPLLEDGELSVGVSIDISHTAPTPIGDTVTAVATFKGLEGKSYLFEVKAYDTGGEIGKGVHKRMIINSKRLLAGAKKRCNL
jgi:fluoroacetyl-CoA thioesterase